MNLITIKELSVSISVKEPTLYLWVEQSFIPYYKLGKLIRFSPDEIDTWLKTRKKEPHTSVNKSRKNPKISNNNDIENIIKKAIDEVN